MINPGDYTSKFHAYQLEQTYSADPTRSVGKLAGLLFDAQVEPKPHQIDAALFALQTPFLKGVILADEVGLGKTIEAGIVISQLWAERKRRILVIAPSSLRQQWQQELDEKFAIPSILLDRNSMNDFLSTNASNSATNNAKACVYICSYEFANTHTLDLSTPWDLIVCDEAHRLRSYWKPQAKIAQSVAAICDSADKAVMLTATPLQNGLQELYGIVSVFDPAFFHSFEAFRERYIDNPAGLGNDDLSHRVSHIAKRTLRKDAQRYIHYTQRTPLTVAFTPSHDEQMLYDRVNAYLMRPHLYAFPSSQRFLSALIIRKRLGSSSLALARTLSHVAQRLEDELNSGKKRNSSGQFFNDMDVTSDIQERLNANSSSSSSSSSSSLPPQRAALTPQEEEEARLEVAELREIAAIAYDVKKNAKAEKLIDALNQGFTKLREIEAPEKAIIFTDSTVTQEYLEQMLTDAGWGDNIVPFNGTNNSPRAQEIYAHWMSENAGSDLITGVPSADKRKALVDEFRERGRIMLATEAAAEGINLQFCAMLVNYDLPWNPQRVEQRIGRVHRFGQKHNVIVVNFSNKGNRAEERILELLTEKFQLFTSVFGASDEVLGSIEDGLDFEKRINDILNSCKTADEIDAAFDKLDAQFSTQISREMKRAQAKVFDNLDPKVQDKLKSYDAETRVTLNTFERLLLSVTQHELTNYADFSNGGTHFHLSATPDGESQTGDYYFKETPQKGAHQYRFSSTLCQWVLYRAKSHVTPPAEITFSVANSSRVATPIRKIQNSSGTIRAEYVTYSSPHSASNSRSLEKSTPTETYVVTTGNFDDGTPLDDELIADILELTAINARELTESSPECDAAIAAKISELTNTVSSHNAQYLDEQEELVDSALKDLRATYDARIRELHSKADTSLKEAHKASDAMQRLEFKRNARQYEAQADDVDDEYRIKRNELRRKSEEYLSRIQEALQPQVSQKNIFTIHWKIV